MDKRKLLTEYEKGQIDTLKLEGHSNRAIGRLLKRSEYCIRHYLNNVANPRVSQKRGPKKKLSDTSKRRIQREASNNSISVAKLKDKLDLEVSPVTIWRVLKESAHLKFTKMKKKPLLNSQHKQKRLLWAKEKICWGNLWKNVIWSDEKKFNLDGPDGFASYWHDLRKEEILFSKRHTGGGSLMIWGCFNYNGKSSLAFISGRQDQHEYQDILERHLLPFKVKFGGENVIFQQDGAKCHTARSTMKWFKDQNIEVMDWPPYSPDLSPIENLWGILVRKVYENGRQFDNVNDLKVAIIRSWTEIPTETLEILSMTMSNRLYELILARGGPIKY